MHECERDEVSAYIHSKMGSISQVLFDEPVNENMVGAGARGHPGIPEKSFSRLRVRESNQVDNSRAGPVGGGQDAIARKSNAKDWRDIQRCRLRLQQEYDLKTGLS